MISCFGLNASTLVSNTNTSLSTEEGEGFGLAFLDFVTELASRPTVPHVLSLSLGSLSAASCDLLCSEAVKTGQTTHEECHKFLQEQRQVCMFLSQDQVARINHGLMAIGLRGTSVFGSSGDGGSHWSFGPFHGFGKLPKLLNQIGCEFNFPIFPSPSPCAAAARPQPRTLLVLEPPSRACVRVRAMRAQLHDLCGRHRLARGRPIEASDVAWLGRRLLVAVWPAGAPGGGGERLSEQHGWPAPEHELQRLGPRVSRH